MKQGYRHVIVLVTPAYQPRLAGISRYAKHHGWQLTILDRIARQPRGWCGDGALVTLRDNPAPIAFVKSLRRRGIPVVDLTLNHPELRIPRVSGDHCLLGRIAREHFEERNFRNFAWFSTGWLNIHRLRYEGFARAPTARAVAAVPRWVFSEEAPDDRLDDFRWFDKWLCAKIVAAPKPLAILAYDDADAARVLGACLVNGISVPEEVAIMGIGGDRLICESQPVPLSSIEHDQGRTGYEGAKLLDRLMDGAPAPGRPVLIPPRGITIRASTDVIAASSPIMRKALEYIRSNIASPFGLSQIADALGVSRSTVHRLFSVEVGRTVGEEILRQRIVFAKRLLMNESIAVSEIARTAGFCNPGHFTNAFKSAQGVTPTAFRRIFSTDVH